MTMSARGSIYLCAVMCLIGTMSCKSMQNGSHAQVPAKDRELPREPINIVNNIPEMNQSSWKVSALEGASHKDFESIFFLDETHGWAGGRGVLYRTSNGGQTWEQVKIDMPPNTNVAGIAFSAPLGWVALQQNAPDLADFQDNQIQLMRTSDGGQSWQLQYTNKPALITRISFVNEQEGWLVGLEYVGTKPFDTALLVLHTSNQGKDWVNVSEDLNRIAVNDKGFVIGWVEDIVAEGPLTATILTSGGHLFKTNNGGRSWQQIDDKRNELLSPYMSACCLGFTTDKLHWIAGGQFGTEGTGSLLAVEQANGSWQRYHLAGVYLRDVLYLSEKQIFACGSSLPIGSRKSLNPTDGVILSSSDGGLNWSGIYRNTKVKSINALAAVDSEHIQAVGDNGLILRLEHVSTKLDPQQK